ncbi:MAG: polysaccharide biosynthesis protein [Dethiobacteria bacterium]
MLGINNTFKKIVLALLDAVMIGASLFIALVLRFEGRIPSEYTNNFESLLWPVIAVQILIFIFFGIYRRLWRYASVDELLLIVFTVGAGSTVSLLYSWYFELMLPRSVYVIYGVLLLFFIGGSRFSLRVLAKYLKKINGNNNGRRPVLIVGAGDAGAMAARELKKHESTLGTRLVGFIDDDPNKRRQVIHGLPVLGTRDDLPGIVEEKGIKEIVIAMPSAAYSEQRKIINLCKELPVKLKIIPGIFELLGGQVNLTHLKEVEIEDLLKREQVQVDIQEISGYLSGKVIMVTGAGGSIGSELCRQVSLLGPQALLLLDHNENGIFYINRELAEKNPELKVYPLVRDVQDFKSLEEVFQAYRPQVVFHAAAHKHVPLMEANAGQAVQNNVQGTKNLVDLSERYGVERFVFISTDKAVNPASVMGATKRASEIYMQHRARKNGDCIFCAVRFGNVLGSRGSVVPLFKEQIAGGGPLTVTHPEMTRYFMTIPEAVQLVIQAGALGEKGMIFILDMGEPVKIMDLAKDMILLSGLQPGKDIEIKLTGMRPGEKLCEELFSDRENFMKTKHERIYIAPDTRLREEDVLKELHSLSEIVGTDLGLLLGFKEYTPKI